MGVGHGSDMGVGHGSDMGGGWVLGQTCFGTHVGVATG